MKFSDALAGVDLKSLADQIISHTFESIMVTAVSDSEHQTPIVFVNDAFTALTGYTAEDVLGKSPTLLQGEDTDRAVLDQLRDDLDAGRVFEGATTNYRKDGSKFVMHWRVVPILSEDKKPQYFVAVQREKHT
jgi:PAS domain S-box-containing protein